MEAATGVHADKQRYWVWKKRQNETLRPNTRLKPSEEQQTLVDLRDYREKQVCVVHVCDYWVQAKAILCVCAVRGL